MIVLDTNVVSELIRAAPYPGVRAWINFTPSTQIATSAITATGLYYGVARLPVGQCRQQLAVAITALLNDALRGRIAPFDECAARWYADVITERALAAPSRLPTLRSRPSAGNSVPSWQSATSRTSRRQGSS